MSGNTIVIGSMNMDLVVTSTRSPERGETIIGRTFNLIPGGKGANQAAAIGKLGGRVSFVSACGNDDFGCRLLSSLQEKGVDTENVFRVDTNTGVALITVEDSGDNRIIVVPGANAALTSDKIDLVEGKIKEADTILLQMEIPLETIIHTIEIGKKHGVEIILDPAPAQKLTEDIYRKIDYLLPNTGELQLLVPNEESENKKLEQLLTLGVRSLLVTRGDKGSSLYRDNYHKDYPAIKVNAVDTTAAGDTFAGALAFGLQKNWEIDKAIEFANHAAAISVTRPGAQNSLPTLEEVETFMNEGVIDE